MYFLASELKPSQWFPTSYSPAAVETILRGLAGRVIFCLTYDQVVDLQFVVEKHRDLIWDAVTEYCGLVELHLGEAFEVADVVISDSGEDSFVNSLRGLSQHQKASRQETVGELIHFWFVRIGRLSSVISVYDPYILSSVSHIASNKCTSPLPLCLSELSKEMRGNCKVELIGCHRVLSVFDDSIDSRQELCQEGSCRIDESFCGACESWLWKNMDMLVESVPAPPRFVMDVNWYVAKRFHDRRLKFSLRKGSLGTVDPYTEVIVGVSKGMDSFCAAPGLALTLESRADRSQIFVENVISAAESISVIESGIRA